MPRSHGNRTGRRTAGLTGLRGQVLDALRTATEPVGVNDLADECGVHRNTVRAHLEVLAAEGLVASDSQPTGGKGRPRQVYRATAAGLGEGDRNHLLLAQVLAEQLTRSSDRPAESARRVAREWGRDIVASRHEGDSGEHARAGRRMLHDALEAIGFQPDRRLSARTSDFVMLNCPFREALDGYQEVVCAVHLGLMEGILTASDGGAAEPIGLEPFGAREGCRAWFR